jgi:hypothetical protein
LSWTLLAWVKSYEFGCAKLWKFAMLWANIFLTFVIQVFLGLLINLYLLSEVCVIRHARQNNWFWNSFRLENCWLFVFCLHVINVNKVDSLVNMFSWFMFMVALPTTFSSFVGCGVVLGLYKVWKTCL